MKLFKKVLAVVLVGAMAVSMLTACGSVSAAKAKAVKDALKEVGVSTTSELNAQAGGAMDKLQAVTAAITNGTIDLDKVKNDRNGSDENTKKIQAELAKMTQFTFADEANGKYDLYIWTNGSYGRPDSSHPGSQTFYPYLMKVTPIHVNTPAILGRLLSEDFVKKGEFVDTKENLEILKKVLVGANVAGISCEKVYGMDMLVVAVKKDSPVKDYSRSTLPTT